jgi:hypothetical protein
MSFQLSSREVKSIGLMGGLCLGAGILYQTLVVLLNQSTEVGQEDPQGQQLEQLPCHRDLYNLLVRQLDTFASLKPWAYRDAKTYADRLCVMHHALITQNLPVSHDHVIDALTYQDMCKRSIERMQKEAARLRKETGKRHFSRMAADIQNLNKKIYPLIQSLASDIYRKHHRSYGG